MLSFTLTPVESRILGCLLEKERLTPENYPLSLNSLAAACNQATNREPVTAYDLKTVEAGTDSLRAKKLATVVFGAGSRVQKYRHNLLDQYELERGEVALLCSLLLRGPQTPGELRGRAERMHHFGSLEEVESFLAALAKEDVRLVRVLPVRLGQKEERYVQLLSGEPVLPEAGTRERSASPSDPEKPAGGQSRVEALENGLSELKKELELLREEFASFRKQFE
jgi:uncharacterized protein YceH (UPF0502 family)